MLSFRHGSRESRNTVVLQAKQDLAGWSVMAHWGNSHPILPMLCMHSSARSSARSTDLLTAHVASVALLGKPLGQQGTSGSSSPVLHRTGTWRSSSLTIYPRHSPSAVLVLVHLDMIGIGGSCQEQTASRHGLFYRFGTPLIPSAVAHHSGLRSAP